MYVKCEICNCQVVDSPSNIMMHLKGTNHIKKLKDSKDKLLEYCNTKFGTVRKDKRQKLS